MAQRGRPRKKITVDDVVREITDNKLNKFQIAEKYTVSVDTVERRMKEASKEAQKSAKTRINPDDPNAEDQFFAGFEPKALKVTAQSLPEGTPGVDWSVNNPSASLSPELLAYQPAYGPFGSLLAPKPRLPEINGKKVGEFNAGDWFDWLDRGQELRRQASWSGATGPIRIPDNSGNPVVLTMLGDTHLGSWGTDHRLVRKAFNEIQDTPGLYVALMGDLPQMSIKMRGVNEVCDNELPPELQEQFVESLLDMIIDSIVFSTWCNHAVERQQQQAGSSHVKYLLNRRSVYFDGIGHPDVVVGDQTYKMVASHKFRGNSINDSTAGPKRYLRLEAPDREICMQGDLHRPGIAQYWEGGAYKIAMTGGTHQTHSGYAERYFSLRTCTIMPSLVLYPDQHRAVPHWNLDEALKSIGR